MSKISFCIRAVTSLDNTDINNVTDAVERYMAGGVEVQVAQAMAVNDALENLKIERSGLEALLKAQYPDIVDPPKPARKVRTAPQASAPGPQAAETAPRFRDRGPEVQQADTELLGAFGSLRGGKSAIAQMVRDAGLNASESRGWLQVMTNDQIAESYKLPAMTRLFNALGKMGSTANRLMEKSAEVTKIWRSLGDRVGVTTANVMLKSTLAQAHVSIKENGSYLTADAAWEHPSNAHLERTEEGRAKFDAIYKEFAGLPAAAKRTYDLVRDDLAAQRMEQRAAFFKQAAGMYGPALSRVLSASELDQLASSEGSIQAMFQSLLGTAGTQNERAALLKLRESLRDVDQVFRAVKGPYFPLVRFGDHVVVLKSQKVQELAAGTEQAKADLQALLDAEPDIAPADFEAYLDRVKQAKKNYAEARKGLDGAKQATSDYTVRFYETAAQAENARRELAASNPGASVVRTLREDYLRGVSGAAPSFIRQAEEAIRASMAAGGLGRNEDTEKAVKAMRDLWMQQSPERSALRSELSRRGIDGVNAEEMLRGYAQHSRNNAWRTSRLSHQQEVTENLLALGNDKSNPKAMAVLNEMKRRFAGNMVMPDDGKLLQGISNVSYFWQLGFNASYFLTNATQAWTTSLPYMSGRHGLAAAASELAGASKTVIAMLRNATAESIKENGAVVGLQLRITDDLIRKVAKSDAEYDMLRALTDNGTIDITTKHDLGMTADGTGRIPVVSKVFELSGVLANYPEVYNRLSTALAAYRLESAKVARETELKGDDAQNAATAYAQRVIDRTHFNYSQENAPSIMRGPVARVLLQFKRYQQGMLYLYGSLAKTAFVDSAVTAEEKAEARKSLMYTLGTVLATAGTAGLPIAAPVALLAKLIAQMGWDDDDEPELMQMGYNGMKDILGEGVAQAIVKGLPTLANIDLSGKVGSGSILDPLAFAKTEDKKILSGDYMLEAGFSLLGPAAAMARNMATGAGDILKGEVGRGTAEASPVALANLVKAFRVAQEGESTRKGDVLMTPEEFNAIDIVAKGAGFSMADSNDMYQNRAAFNRAEQRRKDARGMLLSRYGRGDESAVEDIAEFNERNAEAAITPTKLQQYLKRLRERQAGMREGLAVNKQNRGLAEDFLTDE